ncbi:Histone-lysine N-methyltransferase SMYD3 [Chionoecetes opilio]|uniref:Histone-lysine N-methyltransferase SMYD3 n=1 Tax=Chionoecetes opilio TaxID=41210 RepID=A0A8J4YG43_CHIOP|nr:Histone-lysine N-methyltransferase SMYD3 [Chionoecetes opilio]
MRDCGSGRMYGSNVYNLGPKIVRPVAKGDVILSALPFAHALNYNYLSMYCDTCAMSLRERLLHPCGECWVVWYCSKECRQASHAWHRHECFLLKRRKNNLPNSFVRLLARVIFKLREGGDRHVERYCAKGARRFRDLMNHYADLKTSEDMRPFIDKTLVEVRKYIGERLMPNDSDFLGIFGRTLVNCFSFVDKTMLSIGCSVYLAASIFDHDCSPNCFVTFSGLKVEIRSLIDMPDLDFAKCRISYVDPVSTAAARREDLYKGWFFLCECKTCEDEERARLENSIKCETPNCQGIVSLPEISDTAQRIKLQIATAREREGKKKEKERESLVRKRWRREERKKTSSDEDKQKEEEGKGEEEVKIEEKDPRCEVCGWTASKGKVKEYWDIVASVRKKLKSIDDDNLNIEECIQILENQTMFSSMNAWRVRMLDIVFNSAILNSCWSLALKYGEENYDGMRFYYDAKSPMLSLFLFKLGKAKIYLKEFREGLRILAEAETWLTTGLSASHPILDDLHQLTLLTNEDRELYLERWCGEKRQQQLPCLRSEDEALAKIFETLNQISRSPSRYLSGV